MKSIRTNTLFVLGDQDKIVPLECISRVRKNLAETYLWILPNTEHGAHEGENKKKFVQISKDFSKAIGKSKSKRLLTAIVLINNFRFLKELARATN